MCYTGRDFYIIFDYSGTRALKYQMGFLSLYTLNHTLAYHCIVTLFYVNLVSTSHMID